MIPIDPEKRNDNYYRYKMPAIQTKVEGSGNGIKTVFPNIHDVCMAINRPEEVLMKFFQSEMGAQRTVLAKDDKFLIMGNHAEDRVQEKVYDFIRKFVLCRSCRNPETRLLVDRKKNAIYISMRCGACGEVIKLTDLDKRHVTAIAAYYAKNPQQLAPKGAGTAEASQEASAQKADAETTAVPEPAPAAKAVIQDSDIKDMREPPQHLLARCMQQHSDDEKILKYCMELMSSYNLPEKRGPLLVLDAIFVAGKDFIAGIRRHASLLRHFSTPLTTELLDDATDEAKKTNLLRREKQLKCITMDECARLCNKSEKPDKIVVVLFVLFIEGILSRSVIEEWCESTKPISKVDPEVEAMMRKVSEPLVKWLKGESGENTSDG